MYLSDNAPLLIFHRCDDELHCDQMTKAQFEASLNGGDYELIKWAEKWPTRRLDEWPARTGCAVLGPVVCPCAVSRVTKWEVV